jgi:Domain of unknown function (DUF4394)/PEP-CTERM motif
MSRLRRNTPATLAVASLAVLAGTAHAVPMIGLTTTHALVSFDSASPLMASAPVTVTGLQAADERLLAIDLRPSNGLLYGVSSAARVYTVAANGSASFVGQLAEPLLGAVSIDFNPVADLASRTTPATASLRVVSSSGQNLAANASTGGSTIASDIQTGIGAVAYANNDLDPATGTVLYYVDTASDQLMVATGAFNAPNITPVGALGIDANGVAGLEIVGANLAFAAFTDADSGKSSLYRIDLASGAATFAGEFGIGGSSAIAPPLLGLTVSAVPEPQTYALMLGGLAALGFLGRRRISAARPTAASAR